MLRLLSFIFWIGFSGTTYAASLCSEPIKNIPALGFTISVWNPWDADRCEEQMKLAKESGFTALTWVPTYGWDPVQQKVIPNLKTVDATNRCLTIADDLGFEIHFKPHLEDFSCWNDPVRNPTGACWRAWLKMRPSLSPDQWGHFMFPVRDWLLQRRNQGKNPQLWIMLGGEQERSLAEHADGWLEMATQIRQQWKVPVEVNSNWQSFCAVPANQCAALKEFILGSERFTPSIYGDFFHHSVGEKVINVAREWADRINCSHTPEEAELNLQILEPKISAGEIGIGPSLMESEEWLFEKFESILKTGYFYSDLNEYLALRKSVYIDWLTWARSRKDSGIINVWPGAQDPVGFSSGSVVDERLVSVFRSYSQERCGSGLVYEWSTSKTIENMAKAFPENITKKQALSELKGPAESVIPPESYRMNESLKRNTMNRFCTVVE